MTFIPKPHEIYKHFKGNLYQVVTIAEHSETGEQLVIYQALYGDFKTYARPLVMFTGEVDRQRYPEVTQRFRFELQGTDADRQIRETEAVGVEHPVSTQTTVTASQPAAAQAMPIVAQNIAAQATATAAQTTIAPVSPAEDEEPALDPLVLEFLDADTLEEKIHILTRYRNQMDEGLLNSIAISLDLVVEKKNLQEKYDEIMNCISMMKHFECNRLR